MTRAWLKDVDWELVVQTNASLCAAKGALHKGTSDGYDETKKLWEDNHARNTSLEEAIRLCQRCHRLVPFCNYNGNTFVAIIRIIVNGIVEFSPTQKALVRSIAGHMVAGTAQPAEEAEFRSLLTRLS